MDIRNRREMKTSEKGRSGCRSIFILLIFGILFAAVSGGSIAYKRYTDYTDALEVTNSESSENVSFVINEGDSIEIITDSLIESDLLKKEYEEYFIFYLKRSGEGSKIQAGTFRIPKNLTITELSTTLQNAGVPDLWVTIPEGMRAEQIGTLLGNAYGEYPTSVFNEERFIELVNDPEYVNSFELTDDPLTTLEGFLYPEKYLLPIEATEEYVITTLVSTFKNRYGESGYNYEQIILASMLEREGRNDTERAMIADIITRRHNEGWLLNIDATLLYEIGDWTHVLSLTDLQTDHPYNTYTRTGYPPTPISNPGKSSLDAALNPESNNYYFYLHEPTGQIHYAVDLAGHNANVLKYLR